MMKPNMRKKRQCSDNDYEGPSLKKQVCQEEIRRLDQLPLEVLGKIFSNLGLDDRKNVRLVCRACYNVCCRNEHILIQNKFEWLEFRNGGLQNVNLTIEFMSEEWNPVVWKEAGARIRTLHVNACALKDRTLKNVIMFCENLQTLRFTLTSSIADEFCSPATLQEINIERSTLKTLIIQWKNPNHFIHGRSQDEWTKIFIALLRICPNVRHYTTGWLDAKDLRGFFNCSCSVDPELTNRSELSSGFAFMLCGGKANWNRALDIFSKLRFSAISFIWWSDRRSFRTLVSEFFEKQEALASERARLSSGVRVVADREENFERAVIQRIARHWDSFSEWSFNRNGFGPHSSRNMLGIFPIICKSRIDLLDLNSELPSLDKASLDVRIFRLQRSLYLNWRYEPRCTDIYPRDFLKRHDMIEHLTLTTDVSDEMLQTIFQFMTRLKKLVVRLGRHNTSFGLVGAAGRTSNCYSIKCLQQLIWLTITSDGFLFEDDVFDEFDFPKLHELTSFAPRDLITLRNIIPRLPALKKVVFDTQEVSAFLDVICARREKPIDVRFLSVRESFSVTDFENFFRSHSSLRGLGINEAHKFRFELEDLH